VALLAASLASNLALGLPGSIWPGAGRALLITQLGWAVLGLLLVEQVFRNQTEQNRWGAKPLCLGLGGLFLYDVYLYSQALMFGAFDSDALTARSLVHAVAMPLLLMASSRSQRWLAKVQVSKTAAFYSASLLLIGLYLLFIAAVGYYVRFFGGTWGGALQVALLFAAAVLLLVLVFSGAMRARLRVFLGKNFFSYRYDYRVEWLRFTAMLSTQSSPQEVGALVVRGLADMVECSAGALWFKALGDDQFVQSATWNLPELPAREPTDSLFSRFIAEREWIIDLPLPTHAAARPTKPRWCPAGWANCPTPGWWCRCWWATSCWASWCWPSRAPRWRWTGRCAIC
jgi:putative PEP-CTERM system histidine kinase